MYDTKTIQGSSPDGTKRSLTVYRDINGVRFWITPAGVNLSTYTNGWEVTLDRAQLLDLHNLINGILNRPWKE
jgi:hypothetical protein